MARVLVYGSLLTGLHNHGRLEGSRLIGPARTAEHAFLMIDMGRFPGVIVAAGPARAQVVGEVYEVDGPTLASLDALEGHPHFYRREEVRLANRTWAWMYLLHRPGRVRNAPLVPGNDWRSYLNRRAAV